MNSTPNVSMTNNNVNFGCKSIFNKVAKKSPPELPREVFNYANEAELIENCRLNAATHIGRQFNLMEMRIGTLRALNPKNWVKWFW